MKSCKCIVCEREIKYMEEFGETIGAIQADGGGDFSLGFHYGSRHDICYGMPGAPISKFIGVLCDDCFERKKHCLQPIKILADGSREEIAHDSPNRPLTEEEQAEQDEISEWIRNTFVEPERRFRENA